MIRKLIAALTPEWIKPKVTLEEALRIAEEECQRRGWRWHATFITHSFRSYTVWTNWPNRGGNVIIHIDDRTGEITKATFIRH